MCGLYPFVAGSGTSVGRHQLWARSKAWTRWPASGLAWSPTPDCVILGQPGVGKSPLVKRLVTGSVATGTRTLILGDAKPDYTHRAAAGAHGHAEPRGQSEAVGGHHRSVAEIVH